MIADIVIVLVVVIFAVGGYTHGLIASLASFVGFVGGLLVGIRLAVLIGRTVTNPTWRIAIVLVVIIGTGALGQLALGYLVRLLTRHVTWHPARVVDRVLGGLVSAVAAALVCWMLAIPLASSPAASVAGAVKESRLVHAIDAAVPSSMRGLYSTLQTVLSDQGLPDVVDPLNTTDAEAVGPPQSGLASTSAIAAVRGSVVKVRGEADECSRVIDGSGFVIAPDRVMTNAHVLAGTTTVTVQTVYGTYDATPVYIDEDVDIAVLRTDGLPAVPLTFTAARAEAGADVVVAGHPGGGEYQAQAARVRGSGEVTGPTFRHDGTVARDVYALRAEVIPGNSGGPLLAPDGTVLGVVFASAADKPDVGYALTDREVSGAVTVGRTATQRVSTGACE